MPMSMDDYIKKRRALRHYLEIERKARPWQSRPQARDPAYRDHQYDIHLGGDPQYEPPRPQMR